MCAQRHIWSIPGQARSGIRVQDSRGLRIPTEDDKRALLWTALSLSRTQLQLQIADEASLDGRTMGLLAFDGALVAAAVAAKEVLHGDWWTILPWVGVSAALCLRSALGRSADVGIEAFKLYTDYGAGDAVETQESLLADLDKSFRRNAKRVKLKTWLLRFALGILAAGLIVATILIAGDQPTKMQTCALPSSPHLSRKHRSQPGCHTSGQAGRSPKTNGELLRLAVEIERGRNGPLVEIADAVEAH